MAKRIDCADMGMDCDYRAQADTEDELLALVVDHARRVHGIEEVTPEMQQQVQAVIRDV